MMKTFLTLLRAYLDARIDHAITNYHAQNHASPNRAVTREVAEKAITLLAAENSLDEFAQRAEASTHPTPVTDATPSPPSSQG